jgi:hypothetical protein
MMTTLDIPSLAVRGFGSGDELVGAVLDPARDLLRLDTALLVRIEGDRMVFSTCLPAVLKLIESASAMS